MLASAAARKNNPFIEKTLKGYLHFDASKVQKELFQDAKFFKRFMSEADAYRSTMSQFEEYMKKKEYAAAAKVLGDYSSTLLIQRTREIVGKAYQEQERLNADKEMTFEERMLKKAMLSSDIANIKSMLTLAARKTDIVTLLKMTNEAIEEQKDFRIIRDSKNNDWIFKENKAVPLTPEAAFIMLTTGIDAVTYQYAHAPVNAQMPLKEGMKVYRDPALEYCPIPTDDRAAQGKNRLLAPGTRVPFAPGDVLQVSLYKQAANQFIDHSFAVLDENFQPVLQGSWNDMTNVIDGVTISLFSGDTRMCENGATEMHEIYLENLKEKIPGAAYIAFSAIMWAGNPLESTQELFIEAATFYEADRATKKGLKNGESRIDEKDVQMKMDITGKKTVAIPVLWDIKNHSMVVVNVELSRKRTNYTMNAALASPVHFKLPEKCEALENYQTEVAAKCYAATRTTCANLKVAIDSWVEGSKAILVDDPSQADYIFSTGQTEFPDNRPVVEGQELPTRKVVTMYDKGTLLNVLVPDAKAIATEEQRQLTARRQMRQRMREHTETNRNAFLDTQGRER